MKNYSRLYITGDGSWGVIDEQEFAIINCEGWTAEDFNALDDEADSQKLALAREIASRRLKEALNA